MVCGGGGNRGRAPLTPPSLRALSVSPPRSTNPNWGRDLWVLTVTALATYVLAFAILRLNHRDKQR